MEYLVVSLLNGVVHGLLLFMVSAGLTLIFGMMGVLNFAHAWFYMLGAYVGFTLTRLGGFWSGSSLAPLIAGARGRAGRALPAAPRAPVRPRARAAADLRPRLHHRGGDQAVLRRLPGQLPDAGLHAFRRLHDLRDQLSLLPAVHGRGGDRHVRVLYLLLTRTRVGIIVRAATYRPRRSRRSATTCRWSSWACSPAARRSAGLAGAVAGAFYPTGPNMAVDFGMLVFVVVVVGGLGSVVGALIASLMIGLFISFSVGLNVSIADLLGLFGLGAWAPSVGGLFTLQLSTIANSMPFLLMLLVLLIRPAA